MSGREVGERALAECRRLIGDEPDRDGRMWNAMSRPERAMVARSADIDPWASARTWAELGPGQRPRVRAALARFRAWAQEKAQAGEVVEVVI